jgi:hypothetical protein
MLLDRSSDAEYFFKVPQETTAHTKPQPSKNMKKNIQLLAALALAIGSSVSAKAAVENGNFEAFTNGILENAWWSSGQVNVVANDGVFSPSNPGGQSNIVYLGSNSPTVGTAVGVLEAGKDYTLTFQLCSAWGVPGSAFASLNGYDGSLPPGERSQTFASNNFNFNNSWSLATLKLSAATISQSYSAWIGKEINLVISKNTGWMSIDNVAVTATDPSVISIVNPSFETGDLSGWSSSGQAAAINWNGPSPGGSQCAFLSSEGGNGTMWQNVGALQANKDYTLTFYAAAAYWQESAPLLATLSAWDDSANSGTTLVSQVYTVTADVFSNWTEYSLSLPASVVEANFSSWIGKEMSINFGTNNGDPLVVDLVSLVASRSYASWATENAGSQAANLDWDNDGVSNGVEFFMGSAPGFTANPGLVGSTVTWPNGGNISSSAYGTQFVVQTSSDLVTWGDVTEGDFQQFGTNTAGSLSYTLDPANNPGKQFVRLKVTP